MSLIVRRAGRRDLDSIHTLWRQLREQQAKEDTRLALSSESDAAEREHREIILADPRTGLFVCEERGAIVGYLHARIESNDAAYAPAKVGVIADLIVERRLRRQGIATRLLDYAREWLASAGLTEYRVSAPVRSEAAQAFFRKVGATPLSLTFTAPL